MPLPAPAPGTHDLAPVGLDVAVAGERDADPAETVGVVGAHDTTPSVVTARVGDGAVGSGGAVDSSTR